MEDLGQIKYSLGIRITQLEDYISLIKDKFIKNILQEFYLTNCRHMTSPLPRNSKSFKHLPTKSIDHPFNYHRAIGLLQYLVQFTRPDLAFSTSFLSHFVEDPKDIHFNAVKHILAYLNSTEHYNLQLGQNSLKNEQNHILGFTNRIGEEAKNQNLSQPLSYITTECLAGEATNKR
ncbi:hypothetical protein O181_097611 [Austropuccinia psidii MF-1]|uniref:Reverse transcriptase Ty1/copia-type domain-containing protein n=1 Tax=Austropuccinia psidii MF-1 TaxID=1389203 RepID=A0A9Q3J9S0_9BASI|nr:hypothetical protein [Austropuccinia psidii MF-1]